MEITIIATAIIFTGVGLFLFVMTDNQEWEEFKRKTNKKNILDNRALRWFTGLALVINIGVIAWILLNLEAINYVSNHNTVCMVIDDE